LTKVWDRVDANEDRQKRNWDEREEWLRLHEMIEKRQEEAEKAVEAARMAGTSPRWARPVLSPQTGTQQRSLSPTKPGYRPGWILRSSAGSNPVHP